MQVNPALFAVAHPERACMVAHQADLMAENGERDCKLPKGEVI